MSLVYAFNSPLQQVVIHPCHQGQLQRWQPTENQQVCTHKQWPTYKNVCVCHCVRTYLHMSVCVCVCVHVCISRAKGSKRHFKVNSLTIHVELSAWREGLSVPEVLAGMASMVVGVATWVQNHKVPISDKLLKYVHIRIWVIAVQSRTIFLIGASLSKPHTSATALRTCVSMLACLLGLTTYRKFWMSVFKYFTKIDVKHVRPVWRAILLSVVLGTRSKDDSGWLGCFTGRVSASSGPCINGTHKRQKFSSWFWCKVLIVHVCVATLAALAGGMAGTGHRGLGYMYVLLKQSTVTNPAVCHINKMCSLLLAQASPMMMNHLTSIYIAVLATI